MTTLANYVKNDNQWASLIKPGSERSIPTTPEECKFWFGKLTGELSPENLSCDGEITPAQVQKYYNALMEVWSELEIIFGREVHEEECWSW